MALINCNECGKEISDKAVSCPNCGAPLNRSDSTPQDRVYLACPKCMSKKLHRGYLGLSKNTPSAEAEGGLLIETIESTETIITCLQCGNSFKSGKGIVFNQTEADRKTKIDNRLVELLKEGSTLAAIKAYRGYKEASLIEAKKYVDDLAASKGITVPNYNANTKRGCAGIVLLLAVSTLAITLL